MSRWYRRWVTWRLLHKTLHITWRPPGDVAMRSHTGYLATFVWTYIYTQEKSRRPRCDLAAISLRRRCDLATATSLRPRRCDITTATSQWRRCGLAATQAQSPRMLACHTEDIYKPHLRPILTVVQWSNAYSISSEMRARRLLVCLV